MQQWSFTRVGSAGGDGSNRGVKQLSGIVQSIISQKGFRSMKVVQIFAEIDKERLHEKLDAGKIEPCGCAVPTLVDADIDEATTIVAQMGIEPWLKAFNDHPDFDIIIGGRSYDPAPYAAFCAWKGFRDLGLTYHMGKIMECGAVCATPKSREALATVRHDSFDITPLNPKARCTKISVAAHTLYEKSRPDILPGPGGTLDLAAATYEELDDGRSVRVRGSRFKPVEDGKYTIKLEGGRPRGFFSMFVGGFRDAVLISQLDRFVSTLRKMLAEELKFEHELDVQMYGRKAIMGRLEPEGGETPHEVGIMVRGRAETQEQATHAVHMARIYCMHAPYAGQKATAGNFAMPCAPLDIPMGPASEFCIHHLMTVSDPCEDFPIRAEVFIGPGDAPARNETGGTLQTDKTDNLLASIAQLNGAADKSGSVMGRPAPTGHAYLADLARVVRSKNSGPYELTFDVMFEDERTRDMVRETGILSDETIARLYGVPLDEVITCMWWDPAIAFKATIKRPRVCGGFGETDLHGSAQHMPLMALLVPVGA